MFDKKNAKEKMNRQDAEDKIREWADWLEVDTELEHFQDVIDEILLAVKKERLTFDKDEDIFKYKLIKPILKQDDSGSIEIVDIHETSFNDNRVIQRFKKSESIDQATALLAKAIGIEPGFVSRLKQRDISTINAVILGFFVQAAPTRASDG